VGSAGKALVWGLGAVATAQCLLVSNF